MCLLHRLVAYSSTGCNEDSPKQDRHCTYNSCNNCCCGEAISVTYSECVSVASVVKHAMRMRHIVICGLSRSTIFSQISHKLRGFRKKKVTEHKMCVLIFSTTFTWNISHSKKKWARYDQKCVSVFMCGTRYYCQILMKLEFSGQIFDKYSSIKFH